MAARGGYHASVWDRRIIMSMVHRYGQACREDDMAAVGLLYAEIVRALGGHDETPGSSEEDPGDVTVSSARR